LKALVTLALCAIALLAGSRAVTPAPSEARQGIEIRSNVAASRFPNGVSFTLFTASNADITAVRLRYRILPDSANISGRPMCTTGMVVNCSLTVGGSAQAFLVPGVDIVYSWEIEDAAGGRLETPQERITYEDDRFQWLSTTEGVVTAYYYSGTDESNLSLLRTANETINRIGTLVGTRVDFPVKLWIYATANDMRPAILSARRISPNANNPTTLGEVVYSDTALVSRDTQALDIVRHEVTHIVMRQAFKGALTDPPAWLDEGLAVYSQNNLLPDEVQALELAIRRNRVLSITTLTSNTLTQTDTSLFYAQSWATVKYLIDTHGPEKFARFLAALRNETTNNAMRQVYSFDQSGLEDEWRKAVGLPPADASAPAAETSPTARSGTATPRPAATATPQARGQQPTAVPQRPSSRNTGGGDSNTTTLLVVGLVGLATAGLIGVGVYYYIYNARSRPGP
jgi:hypothetical protein